MSGILFVVASALFHACWNVLLKKARAKLRFNLNMHVAAVFVFTAVLFIIYPESISFCKDEILAGLVAAVFFSGYHLLVAKAYKMADVSQVYPVTTSSPLFVTMWAAIFFGDKLTLPALFGIFITVFGCFVMNGSSFKHFKFSAGVLAALLSAFFYSFGALFDKIGVNTGNPVMYTYWANLFMTVFFLILYFARHRTEPVHRADNKYVILAGFVVVASSLTYRFGVMEMPIAYAVAIRQISGFFGVLMGVAFFKEKCGVMRFTGTSIIIAGIIILRFTM